MNTREIAALDTLVLASKTKMAYAFASGVVFNLANMLLVAAIAIAGMAVAFPIGIGLAMIIGVGLNYYLNPQGDPLLLFAGAAIVLVAIVVDAIAYRLHAPVRATAATPTSPVEHQRAATGRS